MLTRRQAFDVELDFDSVRSLAEHGSPYALTLGIFKFHGNRFGSNGAAGLHCGDSAREKREAHDTGNCFHHSSL
jgi:hypothetical protein